MSTEEVVVTFRYEQADLDETFRAAQRPLRFSVLLGFALSLGILLLVRGLDGFVATATHPVFLGFLALASLLVLAATHLRARRGAREAFAKLAPGDVRMVLGPEGLHVQDAYGHARLPWSHFERARETDGLFLLSPTRDLVHILPKRVLTLEALHQVRAMLRERGLLR